MLRIVIFGYFLCFIFSSVFGNYIDIITDFTISDLPTDWKFIEKTGHQPRLLRVDHTLYFSKYYNEFEVEKIIIMNDIYPPQMLSKIPKEKLIMILWEPLAVNFENCKLFHKVLTFRENLSGKDNFVKFYYPFLHPMETEIVPFENRLFCSLITRNWTLERQRIVEYYTKNDMENFHFYGKDPGPFAFNPMYKGCIPGSPSSDEKATILKNYKFCYCFENTNLPGYITEKIFSAFTAGCVPIYFGAPNVENYIPKNCFIDFRNFKSLSHLHQYLISMSKERHAEYIRNIKFFLSSSKGQIFSPKNFEEILFKALTK